MERVSELDQNLWNGKRLSVRVACINAATSVFSWWEFFSAGEAEVSGGCAEWHADFSYDSSGVGCELVLRLMAGDEIVAESRVETSKASGAMRLPLRVPDWLDDDVCRNGGQLREEDVLLQGGKRPASLQRGVLHVRVAQANDASEGMLCRLGPLGEPLPLRLQTGDVMLFSQSNSAARITKIFTWSKWSHAAMVDFSFRLFFLFL